MKSGTVPILRYKNAKKAIEWLCESLGFKVFLEVPGEGNNVIHARLVLEENMIMIGSLGREGKIEKSFKSPEDIGGVTQCAFLYAENPEIIYGLALKSGVGIIEHLSDFQFGGQSFSCRDLESHIWVISSHNPWAEFK